MKIFAPPGILILMLLALSCMFSMPAIAQSIQIDSTFTTDAEIFPFENIELISELLIEGDVELSSDTNLVSQADSIITFLEEENDLTSKYSLAIMFWNRSDTNEAFEILNSIPGQFYLTNNQLITHQQFLDFFDILKRMADSNWTDGDLDSGSVQTLLEIKNNGVSGIAAFARGTLVRGGFLDYIETITIPYLIFQGEFHYSKNNEDDSENHENHLKLFPNPAGEYVIVYYDITSNSQLITLRIIDNQGIVIRTFLFDSSKNQVVVDLENIPNGIYFFTLYIDGIQIESQKLIRLRN